MAEKVIVYYSDIWLMVPAKTAKFLCFQPLKYKNVRFLGLWLQTEFFCVLEYSSDQTSNLKMSPWTLTNCDGLIFFFIWYDIIQKITGRLIDNERNPKVSNHSENAWRIYIQYICRHYEHMSTHCIFDICQIIRQLFRQQDTHMLSAAQLQVWIKNVGIFAGKVGKYISLTCLDFIHPFL